MDGLGRVVLDDCKVDRACERASALFKIEPNAYPLNKLIQRQPVFDRAVEIAEAFSSQGPTTNVFDGIRR